MIRELLSLPAVEQPRRGPAARENGDPDRPRGRRARHARPRQSPNKPYDIKELIRASWTTATSSRSTSTTRRTSSSASRGSTAGRRHRRQPAGHLAGVLDIDAVGQGRALRALLRRFNIPLVTSRTCRASCRARSRSTAASSARRQAALRLRRGDGAEGHGHHAQGLRRRLLRHVVQAHPHRLQLAWPTAEIAVMGPEGAVNILYRERRVRAGRHRRGAHVGRPAPVLDRAMGSKTESRQRMLAAGVPVVPGMTTPAGSAAEVAAFGRENGFPLLLKAAAGGGGKGMRVVRCGVRGRRGVPAHAERGEVLLRRRPRLRGALRRAPAAHRGPGPRRRDRKGPRDRRARVLAPAAAPEGPRGVPVCGRLARAPGEDGSRRGRGRKGRRATSRPGPSSSSSRGTGGSSSSR
jgi:hypothetical protein